MTRAVTALVVVGCIARAAHPIEINFHVDPATRRPLTTDEMNAFRDAADLWERILRDPIAIDIDILVAPLGSAVFGTSSATRVGHDWPDVRQALILDAGSADERRAMQRLPSNELPVQFDAPIQGRIESMFDRVLMPTAVAKALNLGTGRDPSSGAIRHDAKITLNDNSEPFDFDRTDGIDPEKYDVVQLLAHEIGHALGFTTSVESNEFIIGVSGRPTTPLLFDAWRFPDTGGFHDVTNEPRLVSFGPAEYYDRVLNNFPLAHGSRSTDLEGCDRVSSRQCDASHWSSNPDNIMTATISRGESQNPGVEDIHALDYMGFDTIDHAAGIRRIPRDAVERTPLLLEWAFLPDLTECLADGPGCFDFSPQFDQDFAEFEANPTDWAQSAPEFAANLAFRAGLSFEANGLRKRSAVGFAEFRDALQDVEVTINNPPSHGPKPPPVVEFVSLPPTLLGLVFQSDDSGGTPFVFRDTFSEAGAEFDPSIGQFGGYAITGFIDGAGDGVEGDVDASLVFTLAAGPAGIPIEGDPNRLFRLAFEAPSELIVYDQAALGVPEPISLWIAVACFGGANMGLRRKAFRGRGDLRTCFEIPICRPIGVFSA